MVSERVEGYREWPSSEFGVIWQKRLVVYCRCSVLVGERAAFCIAHKLRNLAWVTINPC